MSLTFPPRRTSMARPSTAGSGRPGTRAGSRAGRRGTDTWRWLYATEAGVAVQGPPLMFATQDAARHWLDRNADALLGQRIGSVTLFDGEHVVDGPLSLR